MRRANEARRLGTFTKYTHHVPFYRYRGTENTSLMEWHFSWPCNTLNLDPTAPPQGVDPEFLLLEGSRFFHFPRASSATAWRATAATRAQFDLSAKRPPYRR